MGGMPRSPTSVDGGRGLRRGSLLLKQCWLARNAHWAFRLVRNCASGSRAADPLLKTLEFFPELLR